MAPLWDEFAASLKEALVSRLIEETTARLVSEAMEPPRATRRRR
jgi:hypothetical protein